MFPTIFGWNSYVIFLCVSTLVGGFLFLDSAKRANLRRPRALAAAVVLAIIAIAGAKLFSLVERGFEIHSLKEEATAGLRYPGAAIAMALGFVAVGRRFGPRSSALALADLFAPAAALALSVARMGCLARGCCFGTLSSLPWAIRFPAGSLPWHHHVEAGWVDSLTAQSLAVHPLQAYFLLTAAALGFALRWLEPRKRFDGQIVLIYLMLHESAKWLLEFLRADPLPSVQLASGLLGTVAWLIFLLLRVRGTPNPTLGIRATPWPASRP